jgi:glyoxylase-like metal-dependent hydrolase (beta-lactamase superfamily II)
MRILSRAMGPYQTNCYLVEIDGKTLIVDPGVGATEWVLEHADNPVAILNTHGHFDHVWSNAELKEKLDVPILCPEKDAFMLAADPLGQGMRPSTPDRTVSGDKTVEIGGIPVRFRHFPGHTPGCSVIEIGDVWFSGDFLFRDSIGRWDFPYSSADAMARSLQKALAVEEEYRILPGHGPETTLSREKRNIPFWIEEVKRRS